MIIEYETVMCEIRECSLQFDVSQMGRHGYMAINFLFRLECVNGLALVDMRLDQDRGNCVKVWHRLDWKGVALSRSLI